MTKAAPLFAIGIDSGTQGAKALVIDFDKAKVIWCCKREHGQDISITAVAKDSVRPTARAVEPESGRFETYEILQARFNALWKSLEKEFREHRRIQETEQH